MKVGILLTSNDTSPWALRFPDDGEKFRALLLPLRPGWSFPIYPVKDNVFPEGLNACDGYVITGSPASVHDGHRWIGRLKNFVIEAHKARKPLIGACFGHQVIAEALGGRVARNPQGWVLGIETTHYHQPAGWMQPAAPEIALYAAHKEQIVELPADAETIGTAPGCPYAAFAVGDHIMTTEYHPEMTPDFMTVLTRELASALSQEQLDRATTQLESAAQGSLFGEWMVGFLQQPRSARPAP